MLYQLASAFVCFSLAWGPPTRLASLLFFVTSDCPISNFYAPEIQKLCTQYEKKGVSCTLVYEDVGLDETGMRKHLAEYGYTGIATAIDRDRSRARRVGASITPQAVLVVDGEIRYRGRIDNRYEAFGKPRRVVTAHDLRDALEAVLAGRPVPNPETPALGCTIVPPDFPRKQP